MPLGARTRTDPHREGPAGPRQNHSGGRPWGSVSKALMGHSNFLLQPNMYNIKCIILSTFSSGAAVTTTPPERPIFPN